MTMFSNLRGTSEAHFRIQLRGATIYQGAADPTVTPPTAIDILRTGDIYLRQGGSGQPYVYNGTTWIQLSANGGDATFNNLTVTGVGSFANGTAAAPAITFTTDTDTGMYRAAANSLGLSTNGTTALTIDAAQAATFAGNVTVAGDFAVNGTTTTVNSANLDITDNIIRLNKDETGAGVTLGSAGLEIERGTLTDARLIWNEALDRWEAGVTGTMFQIWHEGNDGTGSGLDADLLDGLDSAAFAQVANNLSDLTNVATARTNLGLVAGGTGDIWVEKAGDTMTGNLVMSGTAVIQSIDGSLASPGIQFAADTDTGFRRTGANTIAVVGNGTDLLTVRPAGSGGASVVISTNDALIIPVGATADRPGTPADGMIRFNTTTNVYEGYSSAAWSSLGTNYTAGDGITITGATLSFSNNGMADTAVVSTDTFAFFDASAANQPEFRSFADFITDLGIITTGNLATAVTSGRGITITGSTIAFSNNLMTDTATVSTDLVPFFDVSATNVAQTRSWANVITDLGLRTGTVGVTTGGTGLTTIPAFSVLVANTADTLVAVSAADTIGDQVLRWSDTTNTFGFVTVASLLGGATAFGTIVTSGNTTGDTSLVADSSGDTLNVVAGDGISIAGVAATDTATFTFSRSGMADTAVVAADTVPFFDASGANQPEFRSFTDILADLDIVTATVNGVLVRTANDTYASRTLTASVAAGREGIAIVDGDGVAGNPTLGLNITGLTLDATLATTDEFAYYNGTNNVKIGAAALAAQLATLSTSMQVLEGSFALVNDTIIGAIPNNARIVRVRVYIGTAYDASANIQVNMVTGGDIMNENQINAQLAGAYEHAIDYRNTTGSAENLRIQVTNGVPTVGAGRIIVEYYNNSAI